jgi:hypothetical protein
VTRAHSRLDTVESKQSKQTADITTANTNIATNTTSITALGTRLGGNTQETYLGTLGQMSPIGDASYSGVGTLGHVSAPPSETDFNGLIDDYNALNTAYHDLVTRFNTLLGELANQNYLA